MSDKELKQAQAEFNAHKAKHTPKRPIKVECDESKMTLPGKAFMNAMNELYGNK